MQQMMQAAYLPGNSTVELCTIPVPVHAEHVDPHLYLDSELAFVDEHDAPGVSSYRTWLNGSLQGLSTSTLPNEAIIAKLDQAAQTYSTTILKTTMTMPYTTVFFEFGCAYWSAESESRLRSAMIQQ